MKETLNTLRPPLIENSYFLLRVSKKPAARGPARAHFWMGRAMGPNLGPARRASLPVGPPLKKKYIYIYKNIQEIENATLIKIFIANYFIH